ncbi:Gag-Pro-Pol polyprotein [Labeo rohita]|uniref:Gag-Pro-Pol polyprotein n=1 Tax=Labeo rohita TaxID=84645 RepID=A0ABQ8L6U4_LABRO|nr:Gag-Pro-Pol polyprotein [Labeo rohita]
MISQPHILDRSVHLQGLMLQRSQRGDDARISPSPYDTASSSVSQHSWHVVDEWSSAAFDREHSYERQQVRAPSQSEAPLPSAQPAQFSPFHRPWEETESQSSPQTVINASHRPSQPLVHSESLPTPLPYPSTIRQSLQLADTVAAPVTSVPSFDKGDYSSLPTPKQTVGYRDHSVLPRHLDRNAESLQREHVLVEFLGKMLSELQVMRDHIQTELPAKREVTQSIQPPNYHDPMPAGYPDESVRPTSRRLAPPPTASSNYPHDPGWYPEQRFEPVRAAHLPHPHESYERRRPGYLTPMHRTSTLHPDDRESTYRGPTPSIPDFITGDPSEFTRLKIALENLLPPDATELFRYQILMDHLRLDEARLVADSYLNSPFPYSDTMAALTERFGQPYKLALRRIAKVMDAPDIRRGDTASFDKFALQIRSLVGMLETLGHEVYNLLDFSEWLQYEAWCQSSESQISDRRRRLEQKMDRGRAGNTAGRSVTILHGSDEGSAKPPPGPAPISLSSSGALKAQAKAFCPYCDKTDHYLSQCPTFKSFNKQQITDWIQTNHRCWRCGRAHQAAKCTLKKPCSLCKGRHLQILHEVNSKPTTEGSCLVNSAIETLYLDRPTGCRKVLLKVVRVLLRHGDKTLDTYAVLDDGSERTILLSPAATKLGIHGPEESLALRTIRQDVQTVSGAAVSFQISPVTQPQKIFRISAAFTAERLCLADHSYPLSILEKYQHLRNLPLQSFEGVRPLLLIGADNTHLITPISPVRLGPSGGPAAIQTRLGWTLQGPVRFLKDQLATQQVFFLSLTPSELQLKRDVERLWQIDVLPYRCEKQATRSKEDRDAISLLEAKTTRVEVNGIFRYATPLLRRKDFPFFCAPKEAVMSSLRGMERQLARSPEKAEVYKSEIKKLELNGAAIKLLNEGQGGTRENWYIPHHMITHNGKNHLVFNCSFEYEGLNLNDSLLPGPVLSPSLLGVLLRFREHCVAISGDIRGMFHQVLLLPEDRPLLRFLWRDLRREDPPDTYEWQVLPFGTTCSPCCATFALQRHVALHSTPDEDVRFSVDKCFYVDNCLQSLPTVEGARQLVDKLRSLLSTGGFDIRQWASNVVDVVSHLPPEARSTKLELWLSQDKADPQESTLGLSWHCESDQLGFKHRPVTYNALTMRSIYRVLASQYDPLGVILPYTTRAKVIVQQLWMTHRDWDDPQLPSELQQAWTAWEEELKYLPQVTLPRCYNPPTWIIQMYAMRSTSSVMPLRRHMGLWPTCFQKQQSIPRLELCAALIGAQLAKLLANELTLKLDKITYWTDSTIVLHWLHSESCRYKVFVGTRVAEIQELTNQAEWRYVNSEGNPADDLTRGKSLRDLIGTNRWLQGPEFLLQPQEEWPSHPTSSVHDSEDTTELKGGPFCGITTTMPLISDGKEYNSWTDLVEAVAQDLHGAAAQDDSPPASTYREAETVILRRIQMDSFPEDYRLLKTNKPFDPENQLIRVGGRLRRAETLDPHTMHPIVLDPHHPNTQLLIKDYDTRLHHPGAERVFAELRRRVWILRGREAIKKHQKSCIECCKWRSKPASQQMVDRRLQQKCEEAVLWMCIVPDNVVGPHDDPSAVNILK